MHRIRPLPSLMIVTLFTILRSTQPVHASQAFVSDPSFLPGDDEPGTPVEEQDWPRITHGGPGYLAVWQDLRPVLSGWIHTDLPHSGNETDIYGARLDTEGNVLDVCPLVIANEGRNQTRPEIAWNGENWLVVYTSERPDWYFFEDILARRISPDGEVLDEVPIPIRLENNNPSNDYGQNPAVTTDGTNWVVIWQDTHWVDTIGYPNVSATRIAPDGTILDDPPLVLYQHNSYSFGPNTPSIAFNGSVYLLVWERLGDSFGKRFDASLQPLDMTPFPIGFGDYFLRVVSNGADFLLGVREPRILYRITAGGTVLDPAGISIPVPGGYEFRGPDIAWDGSDWVVALSATAWPNPATIYQARLRTNGTFEMVAPVAMDPIGDQFKAAIASWGNGQCQAVWATRDASLQFLENVEGATIAADGTASAAFDVSLGLGRQSWIRFASNGDEHLAVYQSQGNGQNRILAQRLDAEGTPIDLEPVIVSTTREDVLLEPEVAWNGLEYLVVWSISGSVYGRRLGPGLELIDPAPVHLVTDNAGEPGVGALNGDFYLVYPYWFSGDQRGLKGVRVSGATLSLIGSPIIIGGDFALNPVVRTFGDRWFVVWERQPGHDIITSSIHGCWVNANGVVESTAIIGPAGDNDFPDIAVAGDRALAVWHDWLNKSVEGRLIGSNGNYLTNEFVIANEPEEQMFASVGWSGSFFTVAWVDHRDNTGVVDPLRGDIYLTRVDLAGNVLDPGGIQVTNGPLPEDLPAVVGCGDACIVAFSQLHGSAAPEIQRIGYSVVRELSPTDVSEEPNLMPSLIAGPTPFTDALSIRWNLRENSLAPNVEVIASDGRRVWHAQARRPVGSVLWNGRDDAGHELPSGIYLIRLAGGRESVHTTRVLKIR